MDTNVPIVANGRATHVADECQLACISRLRDLVEGGRVMIDGGGVILAQYRRNLSPKGQPGVGDAFLKHVFDHMHGGSRVEQVVVHPLVDEARGFAEFPEDPDLAGFDREDRVFVAVARAKDGNVPILNATDTDWAKARAALKRHRVRIEEVCPNEIKLGMARHT